MNARNRISTVLLVILVVILGVIIYDRFLIPRNRDLSMQGLSELLQTGNDYNIEFVNDLVGREGTVFKEGQYLQWRQYSWGGLLNQYDFYVRFKKKKDQWVATETSVAVPNDVPIENTDPVTGPEGGINFGGRTIDLSAPQPKADGDDAKSKEDASDGAQSEDKKSEEGAGK